MAHGVLGLGFGRHVSGVGFVLCQGARLSEFWEAHEAIF